MGKIIDKINETMTDDIKILRAYSGVFIGFELLIWGISLFIPKDIAFMASILFLLSFGFYSKAYHLEKKRKKF